MADRGVGRRLGSSASSIVARQRRDHRQLEELLELCASTTGPDQQAATIQMCRLVFSHAFAEEAVLWPAMRRSLPDGEALTLRVEQEHQKINELVAMLDRDGIDSPPHQETLERTIALLRQDVRDEEDILLPRLEAALDGRALRRLGRSWEVVRRTAPTRPHPVVSRRPPGNVLAALPLTLLDRSRDLLDTAARRASGAPAAASRAASGRLAAVAGAVERLAPARRGEDPSTHRQTRPGG